MMNINITNRMYHVPVHWTNGRPFDIAVPLGVAFELSGGGFSNIMPSINITATPVIGGTTDPSGDLTVSSLGTSDTAGATAAREWVRGTTVVGSYPTAYTKTAGDVGETIRLREIWSANGFEDVISYSNGILVEAEAGPATGFMFNDETVFFNDETVTFGEAA